MAATESKPWYHVEAESLIDVALAEAERAYCSETGDKFWARGFTSRFDEWLEERAGIALSP